MPCPLQASVALLQVLVDLKPIWGWDLVVAISHTVLQAQQHATEPHDNSDVTSVPSSLPFQRALDTDDYTTAAQMLAMRSQLPVIPLISRPESFKSNTNVSSSVPTDKNSLYRTAAVEHGCTAIVLSHTATDHAAVLLAKMFMGWPGPAFQGSHLLWDLPDTCWIQTITESEKNQQGQAYHGQQKAGEDCLEKSDCETQNHMKIVQPFLETPESQVQEFFEDCVRPKHQHALSPPTLRSVHADYIQNSVQFSMPHHPDSTGISQLQRSERMHQVKQGLQGSPWPDLQWHYDSYHQQVHGIRKYELKVISRMTCRFNLTDAATPMTWPRVPHANMLAQAVEAACCDNMTTTTSEQTSAEDTSTTHIKQKILPILRDHFNPAIDIVLTRTARILASHSAACRDKRISSTMERHTLKVPGVKHRQTADSWSQERQYLESVEKVRSQIAKQLASLLRRDLGQTHLLVAVSGGQVGISLEQYILIDVNCFWCIPPHVCGLRTGHRICTFHSYNACSACDVWVLTESKFCTTGISPNAAFQHLSPSFAANSRGA